MIVAAIRRGKGIDDLVSGYTPGTVEDEKPVATVGENPFSALLEKYETFLERCDEFQKVDNQNKWIQNCIHHSSNITEILSSGEINQFLQITINYEAREEYSALTGIFITRLIQNSYNAGNNDFQLDTRSLTKDLNWLGAYLKGRKEKKLQISITGNIGDWCGIGAKNSTYTITGDVGEKCGSRADNSTYTITGDVGDFCGDEANTSTYTITGDVGDWCGSWANNSTYTITGDVGDFCGGVANNSTYTITGDVGNSCGYNANNSTYTITGNVGNWCGWNANNSTFDIKGNVENMCGSRAQNSTYTITGNVGNECGQEAKNSTYNIAGNVGRLPFDIDDIADEEANFLPPKNCTYKTPRQDIFERMKEEFSKGNTAILIKPDGTEEVVRKK